jgi:hypothetical protein
MTNKTKIYFIILQRKIVSLKDLENITRWNKMTIIRAVAPLLIKRKIRAVTQDNVRYFAINDKPLKNG